MNGLQDIGSPMGGSPMGGSPQGGSPSLTDVTQIMGGASGRGANIILLRNAYNQYVIETQTNGGSPLPFDEWVRQAQGPDATTNPYKSR